MPSSPPAQAPLLRFALPDGRPVTLLVGEASTVLSIFFIPVLYVVIRSLAPGKLRRSTQEEAPVAATAGAAHE